MKKIEPDEDIRRGYSIRIYFDPKSVEEFKSAVDYVTSLRLEIPEVQIADPAERKPKRDRPLPTTPFDSSGNGDRKKKQINLLHIYAKQLNFRNAFALWTEWRGDDARTLQNLGTDELSAILNEAEAMINAAQTPN